MVKHPNKSGYMLFKALTVSVLFISIQSIVAQETWQPALEAVKNIGNDSQ